MLVNVKYHSNSFNDPWNELESSVEQQETEKVH